MKMPIILFLFFISAGFAISSFIAIKILIILLVISIILWILSSDFSSFLLSQICTAISSGALLGNLYDLFF
jgi:hypothetical protein